MSRLEKMKTVIIIGSSRKGGDTTRIVDRFLGKSNWDLIDLNDYEIGYYDYEHNNRDDDYLPLMKELIEKYHDGLIATSCCLAAEIPQTILTKGEEDAEELLKWWLDLFGDDFYIELQRHDLEEQKLVNEVLLRFAKKFNIKVIATNDSHYVDQDDANAHDILLCVNTGEIQNKPIWKGAGSMDCQHLLWLT